MNGRQTSTRWLGLVLAGGLSTFALTTQAGKPARPPSNGPLYTTVVLGGLRASNGEIVGRAADLNNGGQVVGNTAIPGLSWGYYSQGFIINPQDMNGDGKPEWFWDVDADGQNDLIIPLGTLPAGQGCGRHGEPAAVNDLGIVVGISTEWDFNAKVGKQQAFILLPKDLNNDGRADCWYEDQNADGFNDLMLPLGRLPGLADGYNVNNLNLNNLGQVVGAFYGPDSTYPPFGFLLNPAETAPGVWQWFQDDGTGANKLMQDLGSFLPTSINGHGQAVGTTTAGCAMLRKPDGTLIDLKRGATFATADAINSRGQISIGGWQSDGVARAGFLTPLDTNNDGNPDTWCKDANGDGINDLIVDLGGVGGLENTYVSIHGLNDSGSVAGGSWEGLRGDPTFHQKRAACLWQNGVAQSLESLTGVKFGDACAINNAGHILAGGCILLPNP